MGHRNFFIVSVFMVFILALSGMVSGQRVFDMDKVWGDMRVLGDNADDDSGRAIACGDINGDGFMDIIIGVQFADPGDPVRTNAGKTYVIFGSSSPPATFDLSTTAANITVLGDNESDYSGCAVASGDINGDGYADIIIGAIQADPSGREDAGKTYVIFGSSSPSSTFDLSTTPANITILGNESASHSGWSVASGNINGDGYDDVIIGAPNAMPGTPERPNAGETYVVFGASSPPATVDLQTQANITVYGDDTNGESGWSVASGDVNGDGYHDVIIGARGATPGTVPRDYAGETYVIFGSSSPASSVDLSTTSADITVCGDDNYDFSGQAVASGDANGDGYDDIIICATYADPGGRMDAGETYVILGESFSSPPYTIDLNSEAADVTIYGAVTWDYSGQSVASGDINGDGFDDLLIGTYGADPGGRNFAGETYVFHASDYIPPHLIVDLSSESADITIYGDDAMDESGFKVCSGDVNGDGYDDILIGAWGADFPGRDNAGETYMLVGGGAFITAHGLGGKSWIKQFNLLTRDLGSFKAFGAVNSQGEVHLAVGDVDEDTLDEIAAGQGEGGKSWVKFFEVNGSFIYSFKAFGAVNTNGELHLTLGNFDADPYDKEIAIAQGEGGQSWVKVFEVNGTSIRSIKAFGAANAQGEVHLAAGDLENADGIDEIIVGMGEGGSSWVKIFNYDGTVVRSFQAFDTADNPGGELHLAVGNFDADADLEIAAATGYNGGNKVRLFDKDGTLIKQFLAFGFGGNTNGDVQIAAADIMNDGIDELICAHGEGGSSVVKVFKADGTSILSFKAFGVVNTQGEVHLGKSNY